ncbi:MAG: type II toxin-antitoxin system VapC family toxin, partial [Patescibacteria group bacterium]
REKADLAFDYFKKFTIDFSDETIKGANEFRLKNYRRDLSYVDCVGYILAKKLNAKFLTGDEQFKNFDNVEFVK